MVLEGNWKRGKIEQKEEEEHKVNINLDFMSLFFSFALYSTDFFLCNILCSVLVWILSHTFGLLVSPKDDFGFVNIALSVIIILTFTCYFLFIYFFLLKSNLNLF